MSSTKWNLTTFFLWHTLLQQKLEQEMRLCHDSSWQSLLDFLNLSNLPEMEYKNTKQWEFFSLSLFLFFNALNKSIPFCGFLKWPLDARNGTPNQGSSKKEWICFFVWFIFSALFSPSKAKWTGFNEKLQEMEIAQRDCRWSLVEAHIFHVLNSALFALCLS
jgi:hypothetical protein